MSDILSFIRVLSKMGIPSKLKDSISKLSGDISKQIIADEDDIETTKTIYSEWIQSIDRPGAVVPFHLIPYLWDEKEWTETKYNAFTNVLMQTLSLVNEICE